MSSCSVFTLIIMIFISGLVEGELRLSKQGLNDNQFPQELRGFRVKRGWIWNQLSVVEEDSTQKIIGQLKSTYDTGNFISYIMTGEGAEEIFKIDKFTGEIHICKSLDREEKAFYVLHAEAIDLRSGQPVEPESEFIITVQDINDNAPYFINEPYTSSIPEMSPMGTSVIQVTAIDADDPMFDNNAKLIYSILQGEPYFSVEPKTGIIVISWPNIDREASETYFVVIQVKDMLGAAGCYSATTTVLITLTDVNDNGPIFQHNLYTFAILESAPVGTEVGRVMAEDADVGMNARMNYTIDDLEESATFRLQTDPRTGEGIVILARPLDYESKKRFMIAIEAFNSFVDTRFLSINEFRDRTMLKMLVMDVDEPPIFSKPCYEWKVLENARIGTLIGTVYARDEDADNNPIRYSIYNNTKIMNVFKIDAKNGTVFLVKPLDRETAAWQNITLIAKEADNTADILTRRSTFTRQDRILYHLPVIITDSGSPALSGTVTFTITVCVCQSGGHCPSSGMKALILSMGSNMQALLGLLIYIITVIVLALLIVAVWRYRTIQQRKPVIKDFNTADCSMKIIHYDESNRIPDAPNQLVLLRAHPQRCKNTFCKEQVEASVCLSSCHSQLIGPENEVFQQFMLNRLSEADQDPCVPPYDSLHSYVFEGTGSPAGSLTSIESSDFDLYL
ncbi:Cadherin-7 [Bagarius yarrelli]|uniref:Cadherin-7 n=1 Tax=Bagarius yarrelli TaxID=175774 RepID=A0A556VU37_BAGYA|nr:Cadherin-7 [Bagarius yarrelli]